MWTKQIKVALLIATAAVFGGLSAPARATLNIADSPLFVAVSVDPNVMFVIDDSGSMHMEVMPDAFAYTFLNQTGNNAGWVFWAYPRSGNVYGPTDYQNNVASFRDGTTASNDTERAFARLYRSPQVNTVYYNPSITYRPWVNPDGTTKPNASITTAYHNPMRTGQGSRNLTANTTQNARWVYCSDTNCWSTSEDRTFWPAVYNWHNGGSIWNHNNYTKVEIRSTTATYTGHGRTNRRDCAQAALNRCSYTEEIQNFANWYTYYRSRILSARAGIGRAFVTQPPGMRVGFGAINKGSSTVDGVATGTVVTGVRTFQGASREDFYDRLYDRDIPAAGTPLRRALDEAGEYFSRTDSRGPWSTTPGQSGGEDLACRQSFTILMTDGYWSGGSGNRADGGAANNNDGAGGPTITGPEGASFTYNAVSPFTDSRDNTLADVAMYYWKNDLLPDIVNLVPTTDINPAFWQHMVTFGVGLGVTGSVDPEEAFAAIGSGDTISWPDPNETQTNCSGGACPARLDDLLHAAVNSRGSFFSATNPDEFARGLEAVLSDIVARTAATTGATLSSTRLTTDAQIYSAEFSSEDWSGELRAIDPDDNSEVWLATEEMEDAFGANPDSRLVFTWDGSDGASFDTGIGEAVKARIVTPLGFTAPLGPVATDAADRIIDYIRGDRSNEVSQGGTFRNREVLLGDIVNSQPTFSGRGNEGWARLAGTDGGGITGAGSYGEFLETVKNDPRGCAGDPDCDGERYDTVFVGANDGMLHAFDARTGTPFFSYVPAAVHGKLHHLPQLNYGHKFFVDGEITVADARIGGSWKTVLVGSLGAGGRGIYALDVTRPQSFEEDNVLWELTAEDDPDIGYTYGRPNITRLVDGTWVAIFGNGYNSASLQAKVFVVRLSDGVILHKLAMSSATNNGLSGVAVWMDPTTRAFASRLYAGDLRGTMWRVDIASGTPSKTYANGLFTDPNARAITTTPSLAANPGGGVMVYYGSGKLIEPSDRLTSSPSLERFMAVRDQNSAIANMNNFSQVELGEAASPAPAGSRTVESPDAIGESGWFINLRVPDTTADNSGERVLSTASVIFGRVVFSTFEPSAEPCIAGGFQRIYVLNAVTGSGALGLPDCPECGGLLVGAGAPVDPPVAIKPKPPQGPGGGNFDPDDPTDPGSAPPSTGSGRDSWCSDFGFVNPATSTFERLGTVCDGRQVWRQIR